MGVKGLKQLPAGIEATANQVVYWNPVGSGSWQAIDIADLPLTVTDITGTTVGEILADLVARIIVLEEA